MVHRERPSRAHSPILAGAWTLYGNVSAQAERDRLFDTQPARNPPGAEFMLPTDADSFWGAGDGPQADFTLAGSCIQDVSPSGKLLEIRLKGRKRVLDVSVFYAMYRGHPVVRKWMAATNREDHPIRLSHLVFEALNLRLAPPDEQTLRVYYGVHPREIFYTGRAEDTAIVQINPRTREGLIVMNEAPGWMKRTEMKGWGKSIQAMYDTDLFPFERTLKPGATFTSARCAPCGLWVYVADSTAICGSWHHRCPALLYRRRGLCCRHTAVT